jgi:hypothetical protein
MRHPLLHQLGGCHRRPYVRPGYELYGGAPDHPVASSGQIFPVVVNHGSTRYVTQREKDSFDFWGANVGWLTGGPFLLAFFIWITYRPQLNR